MNPITEGYIAYPTLASGWTIERALTQPLRKTVRKNPIQLEESA